MQSKKVLGLGELLWDVFEDSRKPGGAPANVAFQLNQLGLAGIIASRVGVDPLGEEITRFLSGMGLSTDFIQTDAGHPTGTVTVQLDATGTPSYTIHENVAWDFLELTPELEALLPTLSAVCFGTLAQRGKTTRETIQKILDRVPDDCLKVYDVNLRQDFFSRELLETSLQKSNVAKMNDGEMEVLKPVFGLPQDLAPVDFALNLCEKYGLAEVCITRAEKGCFLVRKDGQTADVPGKIVQVADTVGSGDSFSAALIYTMLRGSDIQTQAEFANEVGTLVATRSGGMPPLQEELAALKAKFGL
ncbi:MAG: carbohydrate kinase [Thermoguttaceae bacterium]|nr:carbohydrate kinase [Thermoguttaceae bacterium]MBQ9456811.1 carbohydrate kinase [Thermoguttaceae bacterium]